MASQPLESIPEETVAPAPTPTPARVTADPPQTKPAKNPGRVESSKRLAERNRLAREAKKQAKAEAASPATATASASNTTTTTASDNSSSSLSLVTLLGIGGFIVSASGCVLPARGDQGKVQPCTTTATRSSPHTGTISPSSKTGHQEKWSNLKHTTVYPTMNNLVRAALAGSRDRRLCRCSG